MGTNGLNSVLGKLVAIQSRKKLEKRDIDQLGDAIEELRVILKKHDELQALAKEIVGAGEG